MRLVCNSREIEHEYLNPFLPFVSTKYMVMVMVNILEKNVNHSC